MENAIMMLLHSILIGLFLYFIMIYILRQKQSVAKNRSIMIAAFMFIYMILFGHGLPTTINKNLV